MADTYNDAANMVALEYVPSVFPKWTDWHVTVVRNAVLDCLHISEESDFIDRICNHRMHGASARAIVRKVASDLVPLAGEVIARVRGA